MRNGGGSFQLWVLSGRMEGVFEGNNPRTALARTPLDLSPCPVTLQPQKRIVPFLQSSCNPQARNATLLQSSC